MLLTKRPGGLYLLKQEENISYFQKDLQFQMYGG